MKRHFQADEQVLTLKQLAEYLQCHPGTIYGIVKCRQIGGTFRLGAAYRFFRSGLEQWIRDSAVDRGADASRPTHNRLR